MKTFIEQHPYLFFFLLLAMGSIIFNVVRVFAIKDIVEKQEYKSDNN